MRPAAPCSGAGATSGGAMGASNLLKPALASGPLRCIGWTTCKEFRNSFEKDRALVRRFQAGRHDGVRDHRGSTAGTAEPDEGGGERTLAVPYLDRRRALARTFWR